MTVKDQVNIRLGADDKRRLAALQDRYGLSQAGVITMLLRDRCTELSQKEAFDWKSRRLAGH